MTSSFITYLLDLSKEHANLIVQLRCLLSSKLTKCKIYRYDLHVASEAYNYVCQWSEVHNQYSIQFSQHDQTV